MILCLDVGNTQIYAGLFDKDKMVLSFRRSSKSGASSDETGIFLRTAIRENGFDPTKVKQIAICSVVPEVIYSLRGACMKYFDINPFILQAGVKTGLKIKYRNPLEVGADRIANSIAATHLYPGKNLILVDLGTATTFCAVSKDKDYLGGSIVAGMRLCMEALESKTAKLPSVEIVSMHEALGRATIESIQSGLYYGHLGTIKELTERITKECFQGERPMVIGTGGFSYLFEKEKVFDEIVPDLVLKGMLIALQHNA
ncbi:type III pantothenate kinase [Bdellovibrio bacteriovorus]|uniref:Type III pantothenate kinase n=1 Tax=Bdellovibrio bacteriovorus str. Tiberius TaxID=1069642 RepID=K7YZF9_BDEBC|nr:type III pantothenate kinase [Bdellovibrio bacteriovorus]AFY03143.1 pantothenate kinase [Bdellovibrio bacteriovorus str. Tiberius]